MADDITASNSLGPPLPGDQHRHVSAGAPVGPPAGCAWWQEALGSSRPRCRREREAGGPPAGWPAQGARQLEVFARPRLRLRPRPAWRAALGGARRAGGGECVCTRGRVRGGGGAETRLRKSRPTEHARPPAAERLKPWATQGRGLVRSGGELGEGATSCTHHRLRDRQPLRRFRLLLGGVEGTLGYSSGSRGAGVDQPGAGLSL